MKIYQIPLISQELNVFQNLKIPGSFRFRKFEIKKRKQKNQGEITNGKKLRRKWSVNQNFRHFCLSTKLFENILKRVTDNILNLRH